MSTFFDENGNPVTENPETNTPTFPEQPTRKVELSLKDKENNHYLEVDADGEIKVKVTEMPPIEISTGDINVTIDNTVEITNDAGNPIPVSGNVNATVSGTVAVSNQPTSINVGNFPMTQQVSIADTVEVSIAGEPTVTISNPTTEIAVSNFPTQFDVNVLNAPSAEVEVTNFPTQFDVNVLNQTAGEVEVTNFPTEIAVNNHPTSIEVSNFPAPVSEVTVSNFPTEISVSNQPTSIEVSNFPTNQTVTIDGVADVNISNGQLSVEVLNNPTSINVDNFPITQDVNVLNTGFDANITNEVLTVDGDVSVITMPPIEIADNQTVNIGTMPSINVSLDSIEVSNFPSTQNVNVENSNLNVTVSNPVNEVSVNNLPTNQSVTVSNSQPISVDVVNSPTEPFYIFGDVNASLQNAQVEIQNEVGNPIPTVITNIIPNPTNPLHVQGAVDSNITNEVTVKAGMNPVQVDGTVIVNNMPSSFEINNDTGNPIPTTITNASIPVTGTFFPTTQPVSGSVNIGNTPNVNIQNIPSVNINSIPEIEIKNDVSSPIPISGNVTLSGTSQVEVANTTPISVSVSNASIVTSFGNSTQPVSIQNTPAVTVSGTPSVNATIVGTPTVLIDTNALFNTKPSTLYATEPTSGINSTYTCAVSTLLNGASAILVSGIVGYSIILEKFSIFVDPSISATAGKLFSINSGTFSYTFVCTSTVTGDVYTFDIPNGGIRFASGQSFSITNIDTAATSVGSIFRPSVFYRYI